MVRNSTHGTLTYEKGPVNPLVPQFKVMSRWATCARCASAQCIACKISKLRLLPKPLCRLWDPSLRNLCA